MCLLEDTQVTELPSGCVADWDYRDYSSGTTWTDRISSKNITLSSSSSSSSDGVEFTSSITFASATLSSLGITYPMTFEWIGRIDSNCIKNTRPGMLFGLGSTSGSWYGLCLYAKSSPNGLSLDKGFINAITTSVYSAGIHHIIMTLDSSGNVTLYVDSATAKGTTTYNTYTKASKNYLYNNEGSGRFVGAISNMRIWNRQLDSSEIVTLYNM